MKPNETSRQRFWQRFAVCFKSQSDWLNLSFYETGKYSKRDWAWASFRSKLNGRASSFDQTATGCSLHRCRNRLANHSSAIAQQPKSGIALKMASYSAKSSGLFKRPLFPRGSGRFGIFTIATEHNYSRSEGLLKVAKPQSNIHRSRLVELCGFFKMFCSCQSWIPQKRGRAQ